MKQFFSILFLTLIVFISCEGILVEEGFIPELLHEEGPKGALSFNSEAAYEDKKTNDADEWPEELDKSPFSITTQAQLTEAPAAEPYLEEEPQVEEAQEEEPPQEAAAQEDTPLQSEEEASPAPKVIQAEAPPIEAQEPEVAPTPKPVPPPEIIVKKKSERKPKRHKPRHFVITNERVAELSDPRNNQIIKYTADDQEEERTVATSPKKRIEVPAQNVEENSQEAPLVVSVKAPQIVFKKPSQSPPNVAALKAQEKAVRYVCTKPNASTYSYLLFDELNRDSYLCVLIHEHVMAWSKKFFHRALNERAYCSRVLESRIKENEAKGYTCEAQELSQEETSAQ